MDSTIGDQSFTATVLTPATQNAGHSPTAKVQDPAIADQTVGSVSILSESAPQPVDGHIAGDTQTFQFDENTLKTLQQFMESQAFQANVLLPFLFH